MIERIVLVKLKPEHTNDESRAAIAEHSREALADVEGVIGLSVGVPADEASTKSWDLSIIVQCADLDAVEKYRVDPKHRSYVDEYLTPKMEVIKAWNFENPV